MSIDTIWYNYTLASAGTITNKDINDTVGNSNTATESVCPNGWSLPTIKQINSNRSTYDFNPVLGGAYSNGYPYTESTYGYWWGAEAYNGVNGVLRHYLGYSSNTLFTGNGGLRRDGFYIRCVSEEKTVTDLTYMQDMTPQIAPALSLCI